MGNLLNIGNSKGIKYELDKEVFTGDYWIDGKPIFCKTINSNNKYNIGRHNISTGLTNVVIIDYKMPMHINYLDRYVVNGNGENDISTFIINGGEKIELVINKTPIDSFICSLFYTKLEV